MQSYKQVDINKHAQNEKNQQNPTCETTLNAT